MQAPQFSHESPSSAPDPRTVTITAADGTALTATRFGKPDAVLTVVYLPAPLASAAHFSPMIALIARHFSADIAQLVYDQRGHGNDLPLRPGRAGMAQLVEDLNTVISHIDGRVVLVVHSLAAIVLQEWLYRHRRDETRIVAIVAIAPVTELPDHAGTLTARSTGLPAETAPVSSTNFPRRWVSTAFVPRPRSNPPAASCVRIGDAGPTCQQSKTSCAQRRPGSWPGERTRWLFTSGSRCRPRLCGPR
ncbi:alpha/beta fold hydrolase [Nocardia sp. MW-W600-9]